MSIRSQALCKWWDYTLFSLLAVTAVLVVGLLWLISIPFEFLFASMDLVRDRWKYRHFSHPQRKLIRSLRKKLRACEKSIRSLDVPSPLDGVIQVQSLQLRNQLVMQEFEVSFREAIATLHDCQRTGIGHDVLQPLWDKGLMGVKFDLDIGEVAMRVWRHENSLSPLLGSL